MKKILVLVLALLLLAVPVSAATEYVVDDSGLLPEQQVGFLEDACREVEATCGFTPIVVTIDSFGGLSAQEYAGNFYDAYSYGADGMLLLVSIPEGEWYILTNGRCADLLPDWEVEAIGQEILPMIREEAYYDAFVAFVKLSGQHFLEAEAAAQTDETETYAPAPEEEKSFFSLGGMVLGLVVGLVVMVVLYGQMKNVRPKDAAMDYVRPGSLEITNRQDIFLYSTVSRREKPKNNSSGHGGGGSGSSRGGAGGRI